LQKVDIHQFIETLVPFEKVVQYIVPKTFAGRFSYSHNNFKERTLK